MLIRWIFDSFANVGDDAGRTSYFIIFREMAIFQLVMDKCCSSDEFFDLTYTANGKRQIQVENFSNRKWADKNSSYMDKKLGEVTKLWVEILSSRRQANGKIGHVVQTRVCRLTKTWNLYFDLRKRVFKLPYLSPSYPIPISLAVFVSLRRLL